MRRIAEQDAMGFRGGYDDFNIPIQSVYLLNGEGYGIETRYRGPPEAKFKMALL